MNGNWSACCRVREERHVVHLRIYSGLHAWFTGFSNLTVLWTRNKFKIKIGLSWTPIFRRWGFNPAIGRWQTYGFTIQTHVRVLMVHFAERGRPPREGSVRGILHSHRLHRYEAWHGGTELQTQNPKMTSLAGVLHDFPWMLGLFSFMTATLVRYSPMSWAFPFTVPWI